MLSVFASAEHPLVVFIDDLQWLDDATLDVLVHLATQTELRHVLFVFAHRVDLSSAALEEMLVHLANRGRLQAIPLLPLSADSLNELLVDMLHSSEPDLSALGALVAEKTGEIRSSSPISWRPWPRTG